MRGFQGVAALVLGVVFWNPTFAQTISSNSPLRDIQVPGLVVQVPGAIYEPSAELKQRCMPDSSLSPIRDKVGRNYQRQTEWRQLMQQGHLTAQASYNWARQLYAYVQIQRQLPSAGTNAYNKPTRLSWEERANAARSGARGRQLLDADGRLQPAAPQQPDMDYNFAVLEASYAEIEVAGYAYRAKLAELNELVLKDIAGAGRPTAELADLLGQFDRFVKDNDTCFRERELGRNALYTMVAPAAPTTIALPSLKDDAAFDEQMRRYDQARDRLRLLNMDLADRVIADLRPTLLRKIQSAKSKQELAGVVPGQLGDTWFSLRASKFDPEIKNALEVRGAALEAESTQQAKRDDERRVAANLARIAAARKSNGPPTLGDVQAAVLRASMELSARNQKLPGRPISEVSYLLTENTQDDSGPGKEVSIEVADLVCKPQSGKQFCTYSENLDYRIHRRAPFSNEVVRGGLWHGGEEKRSGQFVWSSEGLVSVRDGTGPLVGFLAAELSEFRVVSKDSRTGRVVSSKTENHWTDGKQSLRLEP